MKKLLILGMLLFLTACDTPLDNDNDGVDCEIYPTHKDCNFEPDPDPITGPTDIDGVVIGTYTNQGATSSTVYDGRDITAEECDHLDNIGEWQPVWCDEFEYNGLPDDDLWRYDVGGAGWGNNELQYYTSKDIDNAFVSNGVLTIRAIQEYFQGNDYTSARLITKNTGDWLYGKVQVRAKVPAGRGTWPAIWMLPTNWEYGGWPTSGEIDIMEYVGYEANTIHGTIHTGKYNHSLNTQVGRTRTVTTAEEEFHVYEMDWEPGSIILYIDGVEYVRFGYDPSENTEVDSFEAWPFDKQFHLLLNFAIGGNWGGLRGVDENIWPNDFYIDYVRVYQKDYAGMDDENPEAVTNLAPLKTSSNSIFLAWNHAIDDVLVKEYEIYVNDVLEATTSVNGHLFEDLTPETTYNYTVVSVDFAGNKSVDADLSVTTNAPESVNGRVEAEDYTGMFGIQTENTYDTGGGLNVGWIDSGDYLEYILNVTDAGNYQIDFRNASQTNGLHFEIYQDDVLIATADGSATGGWQTWDNTFSSVFTLQPGTYTFKFVATQDGFNINYFEFKKVD
jgi:beta-glucanase (GH16 family)